MITEDGYKYAIQDSSKVYIGAGYKLSELEDDVRVPVKFIAAIRKVVPYDELEKISIEDHFYHLKDNEQGYYLWKQLHVSLKFQSLVPMEKRKRKIYKSEIVPFEKGMKRIEEDPGKTQWFLAEVQFAKMRLSMLGI